MSSQLHCVLSASLVVIALVACSRSNDTSTATEPAHAPKSATATSSPTDQLSVGERYYARDCASCHGHDGRGTTNGPPVIGAGALPADPPAGSMQRKKRFVTARDVYDFVATHMPNDFIGQMPASYSWDVIAWVLSRGGVDLHGKVLDDSDASAIVLHP